MRPLVSILIPAYNAERWIAETIQSALAQTWDRKEVIVVDDGSSDKTFDLSRRFNNEGVKVIMQDNQGAAAARNRAYRESGGDYIQWLDADDLLAPDKIERQLARALEIDDERVLLSGPWAAFSHRPQAATFHATALWADLLPSEWLYHKLSKNLHMQTATWLTSRALAEAAGPWDTKMWVDDDGEYFGRVLLQSKGVAFVPDANVYYRNTDRHRLSELALSDRKKDAMLTSLRVHIAALRSLQDDAAARNACLTYLQNWVGAFYPERPDIIAAMGEMAEELGGKLTPPPLSWKYSWINALAGRRAAKRAQVFLPHAKASLLNWWDGIVAATQKHSCVS